MNTRIHGTRLIMCH